MGRNDEFFHGSNHRFKVGEVVEPTESYGVKLAHATDDPFLAASYGQHLYAVEPVNAEDLVTSVVGGVKAVRSPSGFRVTRHILSHPNPIQRGN
jgi:hypothetical protein